MNRTAVGGKFAKPGRRS